MSSVAPFAPAVRTGPGSRAEIELCLHFGGGRRGVFCEVRRRGRLIGASFGETVREVLADAEDIIIGEAVGHAL